jgi:hypothetical protein
MILLLSYAAEGADPPAAVGAGWRLYRAGDFQGAAEAFAGRLREAPDDLDARTGLGFARLQAGELEAARADLEGVLAVRPGDHDAIQGLGLLVGRGGGPERRFRPDRSVPRPDAPVRALKDEFEVRNGAGRFEPFFVKGINLGAALPGRFATEAPRDVGVYADWLDTIEGLGANVVRVYTLLPPEFYRALVVHNARTDARPLRLLQGVWAELPDGGDFGDERYLSELHAEIARVIDALHGDLATPPRPGHASGHFDADVSPWLLGYILGREWEPYAVKAYDANHAGRAGFEGPWFRVKGGGAMEAWVAGLCDFAAGYEARRHGTLRPVAFSNWPTLDPLAHPTEADRAEEDAWRRKYGVVFPERLAGEPWENDAVSLDATRVVPTGRMTAGTFAAYHVYPNYPDFMYLEGTYEQYLRRLKRYHGRQPLLVAEFGISTSRGIAHVTPSGWSHGGHDEERQGELVAEMLRTIEKTGCAGGIVFEFMDEWFKGTWSVAPLELPAERRRLWFDAESPEQSYGLIANRPAGSEGRPEQVLAQASGGTGWLALRELRATSDEGYLLLTLRTGGGPEPPDLGRSVGYRLAVDTYDRERGETSLPAPGAATIATGAEFSIELLGPGKSTLEASAPYDPYASIEDGPVASPRGGAGAFVPLTFESNRERFGRDGRRYPAVRVDRGALRYGSDVTIEAGAGTIRLRIPWGLLNVTDPSSRRVLHQETAHPPPLDTTITDGFRIYAFAFDPRDPDAPPQSRLPREGEATLYAWPTWEIPSYRTEPKGGTEAVRRAFREAGLAR